MTMTVEELLTKLIDACTAKSKARIKTALDWSALADTFRNIQDGKAVEAGWETPAPAPFPVIPPEFPKLKVRYDQSGAALEWLIVKSWGEEEDYHCGGWYSRPMSELETVKAVAKERLKTDWERRKQEAS
jgi:hypothetical protein